MSNPRLDKIVSCLQKLGENTNLFTLPELSKLINSYNTVFNSLSDEEISQLIDASTVYVALAMGGLSNKYKDILREDAVSLNNKILRDAISQNKFEDVKYLVETFSITRDDIISDKILQKAVQNSLETLQWLVKRFNITIKDIDIYDILREAEDSGDINIIKYIVATFKPTAKDVRSYDNQILRSASGRGDLEVMKYFIETFKLTKEDFKSDDNYVLRQTLEHNDLKTLQYLVEKFDIQWEDISSIAGNDIIRKSNYEMVKYLVEKFKLTWKDINPTGMKFFPAFGPKNLSEKEIIGYLKTKFNLKDQDFK